MLVAISKRIYVWAYYWLPLEQLIKSEPFTGHHEMLSQKAFPVPRRSQMHRAVHIGTTQRVFSGVQLWKELDVLGYRPCLLDNLVAYGIAMREDSCSEPLWALGKPAVDGVTKKQYYPRLIDKEKTNGVVYRDGRVKGTLGMLKILDIKEAPEYFPSGTRCLVEKKGETLTAADIRSAGVKVPVATIPRRLRYAGATHPH